MTDPIITAITCTGHRPKALELVTKFMLRQTFPISDVQWLVVDDSLPLNSKEASITHFHPSSKLIPGLLEWKLEYNTHRLNVMAALPHIQGKYIFFPEDDDFISKDFFTDYIYLLKQFSLVSEGNNKYYHLPTKTYKEIGNYEHASLIATAFNVELLPLFEKALHCGEPYFDLRLWEYSKKDKVNSLIFVNKNLSIGIKGMPGRKGIGLGHNPEGWDSDPFGQKLMEWVGLDWEVYKEFLGAKKK